MMLAGSKTFIGLVVVLVVLLYGSLRGMFYRALQLLFFVCNLCTLIVEKVE